MKFRKLLFSRPLVEDSAVPVIIDILCNKNIDRKTKTIGTIVGSIGQAEEVDIPFNLVEMFAAKPCPNYVAVVFRRRNFLPNDSFPFRRSIAK